MHVFSLILALCLSSSVLSRPHWNLLQPKRLQPRTYSDVEAQGNTEGIDVLPVRPETSSEKGMEDSGHAASYPQEQSQNSGSYGAQTGNENAMGTSPVAGGSLPAGTAPGNAYSLPNYGGSPMPTGSGGNPVPTDPPMYPYPNTTTCSTTGYVSANNSSGSGSEVGDSGSGADPSGTGGGSLVSGSGSSSGFGGPGSGNSSAGSGSGYGSGDSGASPSCPQQSAVTVTETVSLTITVTAGGSGTEATTGSGGDAFFYPPYGDDMGTIGTAGTGTAGGLPCPTGGRYSNGTISTNGRGASVGSGTPSLDALSGNGAGVAAADY
ncbi:MAG: hypothetical protein Q9196_002315 [Gyalolechia fulgens]